MSRVIAKAVGMENSGEALSYLLDDTEESVTVQILKAGEVAASITLPLDLFLSWVDAIDSGE